MAKKNQRASVFSSGVTQKEIADEAKQVERKVEGKSTGKKKILYVDDAHHSTAKINAVKRGMKLSEYIEYLIGKDNV